MNENLPLIAELQRTASSILDRLIGEHSTVALLDYPNYANVGDSLIWLGEIAYLRQRNVSPSYVCEVNNYSECQLQKVIDRYGATVLLQGGGNFGTLWPHLQHFREAVMTRFRHARIIQLPQSLHFADDEKLAQTAEIIRTHGNFTLLVRDQPSFEFARAHFECEVYLCPDMACFIGPMAPSHAPTHDRFLLARVDKEMRDNWRDGVVSGSADMSLDVDDWLQSGLIENMIQRIERHSKLLRLHLDPDNRGLLTLWNILALARMKRGIELMSRGRVVITDRLHAHILCTLLNKPHVMIDNSYGKLGNFYRAWTTNFPLVRLVDSPAAAIVAAADLEKLTAGQCE